MTILFVDFETFFDSKAGYTLKQAKGKDKLPMVSYLRDKKFKVFGCGVKSGNDGSVWITEKDLPAFFSNVRWNEVWVAGHNIKFDGSILAWKYGIKPKGWIDTLGMAKAVLGTTIGGHSLEAVASYYGFAPKGDLKTDGLETLSAEQEAGLAAYCLHDVELCANIFEKMKPEFPASQWKHLDWTARAFIEPKLVLNVSGLENITKDEARRRENIFNEIGLPKTEFSSNNLFPKLLESKGYEVPLKRSKTDEDKMIPALCKSDEDFMAMVNSPNKELSALCEARLAAKSTILETRARTYYEVAKTGPWPFDVGFSGAPQTHRYSGGSGGGGNSQNLPRGDGIRECVEAPAGYKLICADFSAVEARILAWLAGEPRLTNVFRDGGDVYCDFGENIYGRKITRADKEERKVSKEAVLALGYQVGPQRLVATVKMRVGLDLGEFRGRQIVNKYKTYYNLVKVFWEEMDLLILRLYRKESGKVRPFLSYKNGEIILPSGLPLRFPSLTEGRDKKGRPAWWYRSYRGKARAPKTKKLYPGALTENICQGLAGDMCKEAIDRIERRGYPVVGQIHDEVLVLTPLNDEKAKYVVYDAMTQRMPWFKELIIEAEVGEGPNWAVAKANARSLGKEIVI